VAFVAVEADFAFRGVALDGRAVGENEFKRLLRLQRQSRQTSSGSKK
jgi:hypothetical protein